MVVVSTPVASTVAVFRGRLQNEIDVGPVEAELGRVAAVDFDVAVGDDKFDEAGDLVNDYFFDRFNLVHN